MFQFSCFSLYHYNKFGHCSVETNRLYSYMLSNISFDLMSLHYNNS